MSLLRPKSFLALTLIGFFLVATPLILAVIYAGIGVGKIANESQRGTYTTVQVTRHSQIIVQQVLELERTARQFQVLDDPALFDRYAQERNDFYTALNTLRSIELAQPLLGTINNLAETEQILFDSLRTEHEPVAEKKSIVTGFELLGELSDTLLQDSFSVVDRQVIAIHESATDSRKILFLQTVAVVPLTLLVAALFTVLISRPITQLENAIRQLGNRELARTIRVSGPRDISSLGEQLNWLRVRLKEVNDEKNRFLGHVSHELKTPMASIREGTELLAEQIVGPLTEKQKEVARIINESSRRLQRLIENLLSYNVAQAKNPTTFVQPVAIDGLIKRVIDNHLLIIRGKELEFDMSLEEETLFGDRNRLEAVMDNLVSNAIKHTPPHGKIVISMRRKDDNLVLDISDSGPGVPAEERARIFEAFYTGTARQDGHLGGTGLGLSIAREHVLAHDGTLELIDSDGQQGAHFRVTLPNPRMRYSA